MPKNHPKIYTKPPNSGYGNKQRDLAVRENASFGRSENNELRHEPYHDHHGDEHFQDIKNGGRLRGSMGVKVFTSFWISFRLAKAFYTDKY